MRKIKDVAICGRNCVSRVWGCVVLAFLLATPVPGSANNLVLENASLKEQSPLNDYTHIEFDVSWENSWRTSSAPNNWDAAWVFAKWKLDAGDWNHCTLSTTGSAGPAISTIEVPDEGSGEGVGALIYRDGDGTGSNDWDNIRLRWNYGTDGLPDDAEVTVRLFAIEMVYVPEGDYYLGDGASTGTFRETGMNRPVPISSTGVTVMSDGTDYDDAQLEGAGIFVDGDGGINTSGASGPPNNTDYPTGYTAFYIMKYEINQGQYANFLNTLTATQDGNRYYSGSAARYTLGGSQGDREATAHNRACNYLSWSDGLAYADWAGLRPMTELEYEKAARGPTIPVEEEFSWGNTNVASTAYVLSDDGQPDATVSNAASDPTGNALYDSTEGSLDGPCRCGIFATASTTRIDAGSGYYGVMELSGNLWERCVTLGNTDGRVFTGVHGDGALTADGKADATNWPSGSTASGAGFRGGSWCDVEDYLWISDRDSAAFAQEDRSRYLGFRCARTAP